LPAATISQPSPRMPSLAIVGTVVVAFVAFIGYFAYRHYSLVGLPPSAAANSEAKARSDPVPPPSAPGPASTPVDPVAATPASAVLPAAAAQAPPIPPTTPQMTQRRPARRSVEPPEAGAAAVPVARPQTATASKTAELEPPRLGPCTERVAALGLCTPKSVPRSETEAAAAIPAAVARPQTSDGGAPCTEAVAALGLCTPKSK
jgi:hypothetical protein